MTAEIPNSLEAEQYTIGAMLREREAVTRAFKIITADDFYRRLHGTIFAAILNLYERDEPINIITVVGYLRHQQQLEQVGGAAYLAALIEICPSAAEIDKYATTVKEKSILRQ